MEKIKILAFCSTLFSLSGCDPGCAARDAELSTELLLIYSCAIPLVVCNFMCFLILLLLEVEVQLLSRDLLSCGGSVMVWGFSLALAREVSILYCPGLLLLMLVL